MSGRSIYMVLCNNYWYSMMKINAHTDQTQIFYLTCEMKQYIDTYQKLMNTN